MPTIESLDIQIQAQGQNAADGIDALSRSLRTLRDAVAPVSKGGAGLTALSNSLQKFSSSISGLSGLSVAKEQIQGLADALKPLESVQKSGFSSLASGLNNLVKVAPKIGSVTEALRNTDLDAFADQCNRVAAAITPLATEMQKVAAGFSAFPAKIQRLLQGNTSLSSSNAKLTLSYANLAAKIAIAYTAVKRIASVVGGSIAKMNTYIENVNLFNASMGSYAKEAQEYAELVGDVMGIDPGEWMRNQGVFQTLATGFGVVSDRAYIMSKNLTQLGYDLSSFFNISYEDSMQKLQSGISGELEPLRRLGYDLSQAKLQAVALSLGIDTAFNSMTQAEKAQLRYYAIMTQVTTAQGDMARTLTAPANQLRILKAEAVQAARAFGSIFIPILNAVLPVVIAVTKVIRLLASTIASLFGFSMPEVDYSGISAGAGAAGDLADNLGGAGKQAKKLKDYMLGIDELNVLKPEEDTGGGGGSGGIGGGGGGFDFELPEYTFLDEINSKVNEIVEKIKEWCGLNKEINTWADFFETRIGKILITIGAIAAGLAAWKISQNIIAFLDKLQGFKGAGGGFGVLGLLMLVADLKELTEYFKDFAENGATFQNVTGMISEFAGAIGDTLILLGSFKVGGALKVVQGIGEIYVAIKDISDSGVDWDNATTAIRGLSNIAIGIGVFTGNIKLAAWSVAIQGFTTIIGEIGENWEAIRQGDWSGVDKVSLIIGGLEILGGLVVALDVFSKIKGITSVGEAVTAVQTVTTATGSLDTAVGGSGGLTTKLASLAKNIGLGVVIIAEVAAAAVIITGAIAILGWELGQVGIAWQPVIDNASTVAIAMGIGTGVLVLVGAVAYLLGTAGTAVALNIAIGTAILLELGVATALFLVEIWAIGKGLDEIGKAWQPVLGNGDTIAKGIGLGTALLIGIGVVTAALGVATVASAGLLPLAIGLGTAILVELAAAFVLFTESLVAVADELGDRLAPALEKVNGKLPALSTNMSSFVDFMTVFAGHVVRYTEVSAISGLSATIETIIGWFTKDPIETLAEDVDSIATQTATLNEKLNLAIPELKTASGLLKDYQTFITEIETITGANSNVSLSSGMFVNMKEVGQKLVTGLVDGIKSEAPGFSNAGTDLVNDFNNSIETALSSNTTSFSGWVTNVTSYFESLRTNMTTKMDSAKQAIQNAWSTFGAWFGSSVVTPITTKMQSLATNLQNSFAKAKQAIQNAWSAFAPWFGTSVTTPITTKMQSLATNLQNSFAKAKQAIQNAWITLPTWFGTNIVTPMQSKIGDYDTWYNAGRTAMDAWVDGLKSIEMPQFHVKWTTDRKSYTANGKTYYVGIPVPDIRFYAMGGFPESGELFVAREAGAEMVGNIGGRTAVANNDQIVEAVALGVYEAMTAAMSSDSQDDNTKIVINLDGQKIYENQQKIARGKGYNLGMGAFA